MVRPAKGRPPTAAANPELEQRGRLQRLAFSKGMFGESAAECQAPLRPSKTALKHHGKDIVKKSQRKNRFLFSFPGLLGPVTGGKIGELKDLGTKNPILYLDFPQGQMKLFGTIVYPKNRYLTLQFSRGGKNVMCEDYFDNMIVFSDAWWIGKKEDNPEEARLEFPKEIAEAEHVEHDFSGGAGAAGSSVDKASVNKSVRKRKDKDSPETELEQEASDGDDKLEEPLELTPVRHSQRNAGKKFRFTEFSPEENTAGSDVAADAEETKPAHNPDFSAENSTLRKNGSSIFAVDDVETGEAIEKTEQSLKSEEASRSNQGPLVQATISTLFKKAGEKKVQKDQKISSSPKVSEKKSKKSDMKLKIEEDDGPSKKRTTVTGKGAGGKTMRKGKAPKGEDDDIQEISSSSEASEGSGEEWAA